MNCKEKEFPLRKPPEVPCVSPPLWPETMPLLDHYEQKLSNPASTLHAGPAHLASDADSSCCPAGSARPLELGPLGVLGTWGVSFLEMQGMQGKGFFLYHGQREVALTPTSCVKHPGDIK